MTLLLLDTLYPPAPAQLLADCQGLGASGCWAYVLRRAADGTDLGTGGWTPAHVDALHEAGRLAPGIVVPGSVPPAGQACLDALLVLHCDPVLASDLEAFSLPPTWWEDQLEGLEASAGVRGIDYGTVATLGAYDPGVPGWVAEWIRTGVLQPLPALPAGRLAWQFVPDVPAPSGTLYDASIVSEEVFPMAIFGLDPNDPTVAKLLVLANLSDDLKALHDTWVTNSSDPANPTALDRFETVYNAALDVQQRVAALQVVGGMTPAQLGAALRATAHALDGQ